MTTRAVLARFDIYVYKDKDPSANPPDRARVPAVGAQVMICRAGATTNLTTDTQIINVGQQTTLPVFDLATITVTGLHDLLIPDGNTNSPLYVNTITTQPPSVTVTNQGAQVTITRHSRLTPLNQSDTVSAKAYVDPAGETGAIWGWFVVPASGRLELYVGTYKYDYIIGVPGDSVPFRVFSDCVGSFVMRT